MTLTNATVARAGIRRTEAPDAAALIGLARTSKAVRGYDAAFMKACRAVLTVDAESNLREPIFVIEADGYDNLLVDAGITASRQRITEALASLSAHPIEHLINTHWHFDHADGNQWLSSEGATILAHENTREPLTMAQWVEDSNFDFPLSRSGAIPTDVFTADRTIKLNGSTLALKYYGPAHRR